MSDWISKCTTCQYYTSKAGASNCLRHPPQVVAVPAISEASSPGSVIRTNKFVSKFPEVEPDDWCGDYQPDKKPFREYMQKVMSED